MPKRKTSEAENDKPKSSKLDKDHSDEMHNIARRVSNFWVGAHVSAQNGPQNAIKNSHSISGNAFALFLKNQRRWASTPLKAESIKEFHQFMSNYSYDYKQILPHGSYLINLGNPDAEKRAKSYDALVDDLRRCEQLGIQLYNFHPGSSVGACTSQESIDYLSASINKALSETENVTIVVENMSGQKNVIGSSFEDLAAIIDKVSDKSRIGICIDTCHAFAAGYDLRTKDSFKKVFHKFDEIVGFKYLRAMHLNDSKGALGCALDRHENLGKGILTHCLNEKLKIILFYLF